MVDIDLQHSFDEIVAQLIDASYTYYQTETQSPLSDEEYDLKLQHLEEMVSNNPDLSTPDYIALIEKVASGTEVKNDRKVEHSVPMLSLQKANSEGEIIKFLEDTSAYGANERGWVVQAKLDGIAISAKYENGKLKQVSTRGDGVFGEDITENIFSVDLKFEGLPFELTGELAYASFELRGEALMLLDDFKNENKRIDLINQDIKNTNKTREEEGKKPVKLKEYFANPRNTTAGLLKRLPVTKESDIDLKIPHRINFIGYSLVENANNKKNESLINLIKKCNEFNFAETVTQKYLDEYNVNIYQKDADGVISAIKVFGEIRKNQDFQLPTDGAVIKCYDDAEITEKMGQTAHHPRSAIAFKYPPEQKITTIKQIITDVGRTGRLTFRAEFSDELQLDGSNVKYATLHNASWMSERDIRIGSKIAVIKANDIIPYVAAVLENPANTQKYVFSEKCPMCDTELDKRTLLWRCPNDFCDSRGIEAFKTAVSRRYFDIESLSTSTLNSLSKAGKIKNLADIFSLKIDELASLPLYEETEEGQWEKRTNNSGNDILLGEKTAQTIYDSIQLAKNTSLEKALAALNIPGLGLEIAKNLSRHFLNMDAILSANEDDFRQVELVSDIKAVQFVEGFKKRRDLINSMRELGVKFESALQNLGTELEGEIVVISGEIPGITRDEAHALIESLGGKTSSSVSSKTTLLIADDSSSTSKVVKAKELGIRIISPQNFADKYIETNTDLTNDSKNENDDLLANFML